MRGRGEEKKDTIRSENERIETTKLPSFVNPFSSRNCDIYLDSRSLLPNHLMVYHSQAHENQSFLDITM